MSGLYQMLVVLTLAPAAVLIEYGCRRFDLWVDTATRPLLDAAARLDTQDHVVCANPNCSQTICACHRPAECAAATTLGCDHSDNPYGGPLCWDCRLECRRCSAEDHQERMIRIEADR